MSFIDRILGRRRATASKVINENTANFSVFNGNAYENDIYREAVDAIARNCGKLKGSHIITYADHDRKEGDCKINRLLQVRPNRYMNAYDLLYKMTTQLFLYNNAFAFLERDDKGQLKGIYPVTYTGLQVYSDPANDLYISFTLKSGAVIMLPYSDLIHLRRYFNDDNVLGTDNGAIMPGLELAQTQNEGAINGIKSGASIRGILSYTQLVPEGEKKKISQDFVENYLNLSGGSGVIITDTKTDYKPINNSPVILDADQTQQIKKKIYNYLGITEEIVNSSYTEEQFNAFYESTLEPIATALSEEFTAKVFTEREQTYGNSILFEADRLQFMSHKTKATVIKELLPMGIMTLNEAREILNLPGVEDGDRRLQALNMIDRQQAIKLIGGQGKEDEEIEDEE